MRSAQFLISITALCLVAFLTASASQRLIHRTELPMADRLSEIELLDATDLDSAGLDTFITNYMESHHIPGLSAAVVKNGAMIWTGSYGNAYFQPEVLVSDSTLFMLASITKTVTSTALMQLYDQGLFELEDPINDYLPWSVVHPSYPNIDITFHMLLTHTSSIRDNWGVMPYYPGDPPYPLGDYLYNYLVPGGHIYNPNLNYSSWVPGTNYTYCNNAVALVGYLVEVISGEPLEDYCQANIFPLLDMYESSYFLANLDPMHVAMPYWWGGGSYHAIGHFGYSDWPSGQLRTSAPQLLRFLTSYLQNGSYGGNAILNSSTVDMMLSQQIPQIDPSQGLIWYKMNYGGRLLWGHGGGDQGVTTEMYCCPDENTGVVILTNGEAYFFSILNALFDYAESYGISASLTLTPDNPPIQIPSGGGSFTFDLEIENTDSTEITFDLWFNLTLPSGITQGPLLLREGITLPLGQIVSRENLVQMIPGHAPEGEFTYIANIGLYSGYVIASDSFTFEKLPGDDESYPDENWALYGWEDEITFEDEIKPSTFMQCSAHPNPFNPTTTISYQLPEAGWVKLELFDIAGRSLGLSLQDGWREAGQHEVTFDGSDFPSGIYFARLSTEKLDKTIKLLLMK